MMNDDSFVHGVVMMMHNAFVDDAFVRNVVHISVSKRGHSHQCGDSRGNERKFHD
jgi:hypothetical protein